MLTKDQILDAKDLRVTKVTVPEWGGDVYLHVFSLADQIELESRKGDESSILQLMVAIALCDEQGNRLLHGDEIDRMREKNAAVMVRLSEEVRRINQLTAEDVAQIVKNAEAAPSDATSSDSPSA